MRVFFVMALDIAYSLGPVRVNLMSWDDGQRLVATIVTCDFHCSVENRGKSNSVRCLCSIGTSIARVVGKPPLKSLFSSFTVSHTWQWNDKSSAMNATLTKSYQLRFAIAWQSIHEAPLRLFAKHLLIF